MSLDENADTPTSSSSGGAPNEGVGNIRYDVRSMDAAYTCWEQGVPHILDEEYLAIWEGTKPGLSRQDVENRLQKQRAMLDAIRAGREVKEVRGAISYGNTPEMVEGNLERGIAMFEEAVRCQGRNLSVNQARVLSAHRQ